MWIVSLDTFALGPSSQTIATLSSAVLACQNVSATTATAVSPTCTTFLTPGIAWALVASKLLTLPPNTGHSRMLATSMPGNFRSIAYIWRPVTLSATPSMRSSGLPMIFHSLGLLRVMSLGTSSLAAASATSPNRTVRPLGLWVITLLAAIHSATGTPHFCAAASTSMMRAAAPPLRTYCSEVRIPRLPPVAKSPQIRLRLRLSPGVGYSTLTLPQSHSSSSATICASPVIVPWPISERTTRTMTASSG